MYIFVLFLYLRQYYLVLKNTNKQYIRTLNGEIKLQIYYNFELLSCFDGMKRRRRQHFYPSLN